MARKSFQDKLSVKGKKKSKGGFYVRKRGVLREMPPSFAAYKRKSSENEATHALDLTTMKDLLMPSAVLKDMRKYIR